MTIKRRVQPLELLGLDEVAPPPVPKQVAA